MLRWRTSDNNSGGPGSFSSLTASGLFTLTGVENAVTARVGGGKASATALDATKNYHRVSTVASAADSVLLPLASVGQSHYVRNDGANAMQVFGNTSDTINSVATATGISQAAGVGMWYVSTAAGAWTTTFNSTAPAAIGGTTPGAGAFTTLSATGTTNFSGVMSTNAGTGVASLYNSGVLGWTNSGAPTGTVDSGLSRTTGAEIAFGNGTQGDVSGVCRAASYKAGATAGVTAGPFTAITSIRAVGGLVTVLTGT